MNKTPKEPVENREQFSKLLVYPISIENQNNTKVRSASAEYGIDKEDTTAVGNLISIIEKGMPEYGGRLNFTFSYHGASRAAYLLGAKKGIVTVFSGGRFWRLGREKDFVIAEPCDSSRNLVDITTKCIPSLIPETVQITTDGRMIRRQPTCPLGAYDPKVLKSKIKMTEIAREVASKANVDVIIPKWVGVVEFSDKHDKRMAAGVYEMPEAKSMVELKLEPEKIQNAVREEISKVVKEFMDNNFIHPHLHFGNIYYFRNPSGKWSIILTDWADAYDTSEHSETLGYDNTLKTRISPRNAAKWNMLRVLFHSGEGNVKRYFLKEREVQTEADPLVILQQVAVDHFYSHFRGFMGPVGKKEFGEYILNDKEVQKGIKRYIRMKNELLASGSSNQGDYDKVVMFLLERVPAIIAETLARDLVVNIDKIPRSKKRARRRRK